MLFDPTFHSGMEFATMSSAVDKFQCLGIKFCSPVISLMLIFQQS